MNMKYIIATLVAAFAMISCQQQQTQEVPDSENLAPIEVLNHKGK